jgi:glycosyltransferase involved in cell wall biosynthesis
MLFSVVIPLFNKEALIERTIGSVLAQSCGDFEMIVVDDGSTDASVERVEQIADPRLRLIRQANAGPGAARNAGMRAATGTWIAFLDGDDIWFPDHLAELAAMATRFPAAGLLATSFLRGEDPAPAQPLQAPHRAAEIDYFRAAARNIGIVWTSATAVRSDLARQVGDFSSDQSGEDLDYWARAALVAPVVKSSRITAYYFRHPHSLMVEVNIAVAKAEPPRTRHDSWPSVALLERIKDLPEHRDRRDAMERYQRYAIYLTMAACVARRDFASARRLRRLVPGHHIDLAALLSLALWLPDPLLRLGLALRRAFR